MNYPGTKDRQRRKGTSHSWSTETFKRSSSKLTETQVAVVYKRIFFYKQVKTWLVDACENTQFKNNAEMQSESPQKGENVA